MKKFQDRRSFVRSCSLLAAAVLVSGRSTPGYAAPPHPRPRPGITGNNVLTKAQLSDFPALIPLFDSVREIPEIIDGIRCSCGCTNPPESYSLLSCFESNGMARECVICQGEGRLAVRLHKEGKTLDQIRTAIDAKFA